MNRKEENADQYAKPYYEQKRRKNIDQYAKRYYEQLPYTI